MLSCKIFHQCRYNVYIFIYLNTCLVMSRNWKNHGNSLVTKFWESWQYPASPVVVSCFCAFVSFYDWILFYVHQFKMHTTRSPSASVQTGAAGDVLDLSLTGSQLTVGRRPSSASPGKHFSRSISVSVTSDVRGKRNTLVSLDRRLCNDQVGSKCPLYKVIVWWF